MKRTWKLWALAAVLVVAGGGYFAKAMMEKKMAGDIAVFMANMPGGFSLKAENIQVDIFTQSAVLSRVSGSGKIGEKTVTVSADSVEGTGLNVNAFKEKGVTTLAQTLTLRGGKLSGAGLEYQVAQEQYEKIQGDFGALAQELGKMWNLMGGWEKLLAKEDPSDTKHKELLALLSSAEFGKALDSLSIAKAAGQGYVFEIKADGTQPSGVSQITMTLDSSEANGYTARRVGPSRMRGLKAELNGKPFFAMEEFSMQGAEGPSYAETMNRMKAAGTSNPFDGQTIIVNALKLKKISLVLPAPLQDSFALAAFGLDFMLDKSGLRLNMSMDQLDLPTAVLVQLNPMLAMVQDQLPPHVLVSKELDVAFTGKDNNVFDLAVKKMDATLSGLGAYAVSADVLDVNMGEGRAEPLIRNIDLALTDGGVVDAVLAFRAVMEGGGDPKLMRAELAEQIEAQQAVLPNQVLKDVNKALVAFLKQPGGTFRLKVSPEQPISLGDVRRMMLGNASKLGISASFTPGK